ncbi:uncharacterized protein Z519_02169 [Cladophialophora bantiana CBS 173.52]|uniref:Enoyl reductase (ER) domain-containing protein n=1 Tax=Cladophialophora bantiana (strain ATCC 10958 / CBS 173.52 / CDC B-1940 / NIH 8579) TaxID=1442370 RepID=A0A0D2HTK1_CLAB1|nr:uncharacterized protein Z519_02169 [Cladophialophora bantiana CBS 173.52]KIW96778.1 hypothetical protein Z519_02169 [Cladophialophora bantiana CBS 173.52]
MALPLSTGGWIVAAPGTWDGLEWKDSIPLPVLGKADVLVKFHAASLNYRDLAICKARAKPGVVLGSDGAGEVLAVGIEVRRFQKGDKAVAVMIQKFYAGSLDSKVVQSDLGGGEDGTIRQYGIFHEEGLVHIPSNLDYYEASTLPCAAMTAWNGLYGLKPLVAGDTVLVQGTGGVSIFALQFAIAAGAIVIATTSSSDKAAVLKSLGAHHIINYTQDPNWGETAKSLTFDKEGVNHVIEVGGPMTMAQSLRAIRRDGQISVIGYLGDTSNFSEPTFIDTLNHQCIVRGVVVGSRLQFVEMNRCIEVNNIKPLIDKRKFKLQDLKEAVRYMWDRKHIGKVVVTID